MKRIVIPTYKLFIPAVVLLVAIVSCHSDKPDADDQPKTVASPKKSSDTTEISQAQIRTAGIVTGNIEQRNINTVVKATGQLVLPPANQAVVTTAVAGIIKQVLVKEGSAVRAGQPVAYIASPEFTRMQQEYLTTKSEQVYIEQEYERQKLLNDENAGTGKVYQQAKANYLSGQQKLQTMAASLEQLHISVTALNQGHLIEKVPVIAPLSGQVNHVYITVGSPADVNKPLVDIINGQDVYGDIKIFEKDINSVKVGQKVELSLSGQDQQSLAGTIYALNSTFETDSRVIIAHVRLQPPVGLHLVPGSYITASIITDKKTTAAVPEDAVISADGKQYIYLALGQDDDKSGDKTPQGMNFKKMEVVTGQADMGYIAVKLLKDLPEDAKIVTRGAKYILAESLKGSAQDDD